MLYLEDFRLSTTIELDDQNPHPFYRVINLVDRHSMLRDLPWQRRGAPVDAEIPVSVEEAATAVFDGTLQMLVYERQSLEFLRIADKVLLSAFFEDPAAFRFVVQVGVKPDAEVHERLFVELAECLCLPSLWYVPWTGSPGVFIDVTLEASLQRDYSLLRGNDRAVSLARALATQLPRLSWDPRRIRGLPSRLGWLNLWCGEVARELGFPDGDLDSRILPLCRQTRDGNWLVKLTEDPFDLSRPDHIEALAWAYWRFDKIGRRKTPTTKTAKRRAKRSDPTEVAREAKHFALRERDSAGQWWDSEVEPIVASSADEALRIHFAKSAYGREPRPRESLAKLAEAYDVIAVEVGLTQSKEFAAIEIEPESPGAP